MAWRLASAWRLVDLSEGHLHFSTLEIYFLPSSDQISLFDILVFVLAAGKLCAFVLSARLAKPFDDEELDMKHWSDQKRRGHRLFSWKWTEGWIRLFLLRAEMSFPSVKHQQPPLSTWTKVHGGEELSALSIRESERWMERHRCGEGV